MPPAFAQQFGATPEAQPGVDPRDPSLLEIEGAGPIVIISMETVRSEAKAARSVEARAAAIRAEIEAELEERQRRLAAEEQALVALRQDLAQRGARPGASDQFEARAARFERQARLLKLDRRRQAEALRGAVRAAMLELDQALRPILLEIMGERSAAIMIDKREVVFSAKSLDVTPLAINRLDAALPTLEVPWPPSDFQARDGEAPDPAQ